MEEFDTTDFEKSNYFGYEANIMLPTSQDWLIRQDQPFLAAYLTVTPHFHYDAISRYGWKNYVSDKKIQCLRYITDRPISRDRSPG